LTALQRNHLADLPDFRRVIDIALAGLFLLYVSDVVALIPSTSVLQITFGG